MRSPKIILENLQKHSKEENYKYERLYRNLYNEDFYLQALQNIYANKGAMTPGIDGLTLDGYGKERVERIICHSANCLMPLSAVYSVEGSPSETVPDILKGTVPSDKKSHTLLICVWLFMGYPRWLSSTALRIVSA